jgi:demethylmenaquinone methyltransferase/2-methoxy-6-polyprenyl-1,4-benzoquinol methylase
VLDGSIQGYYPTIVSLQDRIATPLGKSRYVRSLFATIADRYDFITVILSYGQDRRWKRRVIEMASPGPGTRALDLATGTGDIAWAAAARGARVVGLDITYRMAELAKAKAGAAQSDHDDRVAHRPPRRQARFLVGDMLALPFASGSFDLVTTGYGLRNVPNLAAAIAEIHRVLAPGGQVISLDFDRPSNPIVRVAYLVYLEAVGAALGWMLHRDPDTYRYIPASIRQYPGAAAVAVLFAEHGFGEARAYPVLGGLMAIHQATRGADRTL